MVGGGGGGGGDGNGSAAGGTGGTMWLGFGKGGGDSGFTIGLLWRILDSEGGGFCFVWFGRSEEHV